MIGDFNDTFEALWNWKHANSSKDYFVCKSVYNDEDTGYFGEVKYKNVGYFKSKILLNNNYYWEHLKEGLSVIEILLDFKIDNKRSFSIGEIIHAIDMIYNHIKIHHKTSEDQTIFLTYNVDDGEVTWILK